MIGVKINKILNNQDNKIGTIKELAAVVIPVYKFEPDENEVKSLLQCIKVLSDYPIYLVCGENFNPENYFTELIDINFHLERFNNIFFENIISYNRLLLSMDFYERFSSFQYILIYQLDAYVFRDELSYWCSRGYDFIGAPWFYGHSFKHSDGKFWYVGNGGFSLRNVNSFLDVLSSDKKVTLRPQELFNLYKHFTPIDKLMSFLHFIPSCFGYKNSAKYWIDWFYAEGKNEDAFWGRFADKIKRDFKIPHPEEALKFSFECEPRYLYSLNSNSLPFGCHAWKKYDYEFWEPYIEGDN